MTDAPAWTPGPWFMHERAGQTQRFGVTASDNFDSSRGARRRIAFIGSPRMTRQLDDEDRATATLIAAAPDLYEALDHYCQNYLLDEYEEPELTGIDQPQYEAVAALFSALRKARGEPQ